MNTVSILIVLPLLVVFSYVFDAIARKTKFPSVILLMFTGVLTRMFMNFYGFTDHGVLDKITKDLTEDGTISKSGRGLIT